MKERFCNSKDTLFFRPATGDSRRKNLRSVSTAPKCGNQWHVRLWGDQAVNADRPGEWTVATSYYEERGRLGFLNGPGGDHVVTKDWETAENKIMYELRTATKGESRYCGKPDYRPVPGQIPGRDKRGLYTNGRISRVSVARPDTTRPTGHQCDGS